MAGLTRRIPLLGPPPVGLAGNTDASTPSSCDFASALDAILAEYAVGLVLVVCPTQDAKLLGRFVSARRYRCEDTAAAVACLCELISHASVAQALELEIACPGACDLDMAWTFEVLVGASDRPGAGWDGDARAQSISCLLRNAALSSNRAADSRVRRGARTEAVVTFSRPSARHSKTWRSATSPRGRSRENRSSSCLGYDET